MDGSTQASSPDPQVVATGTEPAAAAPAPVDPEKKRRPPYATIFTFIACCAGVLQFAHEILEKSERSIEDTAEAFRHVDLFGLAGGFVDGLRLYPVSSAAGWAYPWETLWSGLHGMWSAMVAGGTPAVIAGILVLGIGVGLAVTALSQAEKGGARGGIGSAIALVLGLITVVAVGVAANVVVATWWPGTGFGAWLAARMADLGSGFGYTVPAQAPPAGLPAWMLQLQQAAPDPRPGTYAGAASFLWTFIRANPWFGLETFLMGVLACALIGVLTKLSNGLAATFFIPFAVVAVIVAGATVAYGIDHLVVVPAFTLLLKIVSISALPVGLGAVAFILEKGHLGLSLLESTRKLTGHE